MSSYMGIESDILLRHLRNAFLEHLSVSFKLDGYETFSNYELSKNLVADFAAKKDENLLIYEIKDGPFSELKRKQIKQIREYVENEIPNAEFRLAIINPPPEKDINIEGLENEILEDMTSHGTPSELDELSTHTMVDEIVDIEIDSIDVKDTNIFISGSGTVGVTLRYGSDSDERHDDGSESLDSFPFTFDLTMTRDFKIEESEYRYDTDSFYE